MKENLLRLKKILDEQNLTLDINSFDEIKEKFYGKKTLVGKIKQSKISRRIKRI